MTGLREEFFKRDDEICRLFRTGKTLAQIGDLHGITRERVRQIVEREGLDSTDGGQHIRSQARKAGRAALKDIWAQDKHGCTYAQYLYLVNAERDKPEYRRPIRAYCTQESNARQRGIAWEIKLWDWWMVWQESGKWSERGRGAGYVMARNGDTGPYSRGNVAIVTSSENIKQSYVNRPYSERNVKQRAKNGLTARQKEVFDLVSAGASIADAAQMMGITKDGARTTLGQARKVLGIVVPQRGHTCTPKQRQVISMVSSGKTYREIAEEMQLAESSIRGLMFRSRKLRPNTCGTSQ